MATLESGDYLVLPDAPPIPGLRFRHFRDATDYQHMARIYEDVRIADQFDMTISAEQMAQWFAPGETFDPAHDLLLAEVNGTSVAFAHVTWYVETDGTRVYVLNGRVSPPWRRRGVGRALLHQNERRLRQIAASHPPAGTRVFMSYALNTATGTNALLRQEGYLPVRHLYYMVCNLSAHKLDAPLPPGIELRPVQPGHYRMIWDAIQEAMQDHWGATTGTEEQYQLWLQDSTLDPTLWCVAWDGEQVVGQVLNFIKADENVAFGRKRGYTETISVRRPWRKRGIARALIALSHQVLRERGMDEAGLSVDTENISGALRLYEACGYQIVKQSSFYRKVME